MKNAFSLQPQITTQIPNRQYCLEIQDQEGVVFIGEWNGALELGRQQTADEELYRVHVLPEGARLAIAPIDEREIGTRQLSIHPQRDGRVKIKRLNRREVMEVVGEWRSYNWNVQLVSLPVTLLLSAGRILKISSEFEALELQLPTSIRL